MVRTHVNGRGMRKNKSMQRTREDAMNGRHNITLDTHAWAVRKKNVPIQNWVGIQHVL